MLSQLANRTTRSAAWLRDLTRGSWNRGIVHGSVPLLGFRAICFHVLNAVTLGGRTWGGMQERTQPQAHGEHGRLRTRELSCCGFLLLLVLHLYFCVSKASFLSIVSASYSSVT